MNNSNALNFDHQVRRLALGIELKDVLRSSELIYPVRAEAEYQSPHQSPSPKRFYGFRQQGNLAPYGLLRSGSGRYSLTYYPGIQDQLDLRIYDYDRYYIPRRLRIPLLSLADVLTIEENEESDYSAGRVRSLVMFPGAAYHNHSGTTGLRGRVVRDGQPMRWAYIVAVDLVSNQLVTITRGDDRGEFLLILPPHALQASDLSDTFNLLVAVAGPIAVPVPDTPELSMSDNFWDLPLEELPAAGMVDDVSSGQSFPADYTFALSAVRRVSFQIGRLLTGREENDFEFTFP